MAIKADVELTDELFNSKKMIVADLDGTLAESKSAMTSDMSQAISELLKYKQFAVIGGGAYSQFEKQFVSHLDCPPELLPRLSLFPTCATVFYAFDEGRWHEVYAEVLSKEEKKKIFNAFEVALKESGFIEPKMMYGDLIEDRRTQITFSAFGQKAPLDVKKGWDTGGAKRKAIVGYLTRLIPEFEMHIGGETSIDVTRKGIDKAYGIRKIMDKFKYDKKDLLFVGDALFEGGNDYPVKREGVDSVSIDSPNDTVLLFLRIVEAAKRQH